MRATIRIIVGCSAVIWSLSAAASVFPEATCQQRRHAAAGRFEQCVQKWLSSCYAVAGGCEESTLAKCRQRYAAQWSRLQRLAGSSCDTPRFVDNGTTVTDNLTGLVWEKKSDDGSANDWDHAYSWTDADPDPADEDGAVFTAFLAALNAGAGFASANGWRLPTFVELQTILLPDVASCATSPCIDPAFGPFTHPGGYWSGTTIAGAPSSAWVVGFGDGSPYADDKRAAYFVRAVRGGLL